MEGADRIRAFIEESIAQGTVTITNETPLFNGVIDSLGLFQIVTFLEQEFHVQLQDDDLDRENFRTVNDIERMVSSRVGAT